MIKSLLTMVQWLFFVPLILAQKQYQLAPPLARYGSVFFGQSTTISFEFGQPGSTIRYTTNGTEPVATSEPFRKPVTISKNATLVKARSFAAGFIPSETVSVKFFSKGKTIANITSSAPNPKFTGNGISALIDNKSGSTNHDNKAWLGFDSDSVVIDLFMEKNSKVSGLLLHGLNNQGAWIFPPARVIVYSMDQNRTYLLKSESFETIREEKSEHKAIWMTLPGKSAKQLRIVVYPLATLPDWHPGKGKKAWFFIDEIKVY